MNESSKAHKGKRWLKPAEVAERFGIHKRTLQYRVAAGQFPAPVRLSKKIVRYSLARIETFERELERLAEREQR